jgi:hypothetical protein
MITFETVIRDQVAVNQSIEHVLQQIRYVLSNDRSVVEFDVRVEHDLVANPARLILSFRECRGRSLRLDFSAVMTCERAICDLAKSGLVCALEPYLLEVADLWRSTTSPLEVL